MPDAPDFSQYQLSGSRDVLFDLAELGVRLGALSTYDRTGQVIFADGFDYGLGPYVVTGSGLGHSETLDASFPEATPYSAHLVAGSTLFCLADIYKVFSPPEVNRWGMELGVSLYTNFSQFRMELYRYDGVNEHRARVYLDEATTTIQVEDDAAGLVDLYNLGHSFIGSGEFNHLKLVADFDTDKYVSVLFNEHRLDASAYAITVTPNAALPGQIAKGRLIGVAAENDECSIGHMIITVGEP